MDVAGKANLVQRGDPFTIREVRAMAESRAFNVFLQRLDKMIEAERLLCEQADGMVALRRAQGAVRALRTVRQLPTVIERELSSKR